MAGIAQAAGGAGELVQSTGKVLLSTGHGFAPVAVHQPIGIGSRILVADAASAVIAFPSCTLTLAPGKVHVIAPQPCDAATDPARAHIVPTAATSAPGIDFAAMQAELHRMRASLAARLEVVRTQNDPVLNQCLADHLAELKLLNGAYDRAFANYAGEGDVAEAGPQMQAAAQRANDSMAGADACEGVSVDLRQTSIESDAQVTGSLPPPPGAPLSTEPLASNAALLSTAGTVVAVGIGVMLVKAADKDRPVSAP
ncbi:MAG: hypothetical protein IPM06_00530 [Rhizobiales bacterium]|nr:hypothetical protein [Hyphomicrobiales bacterium]